MSQTLGHNIHEKSRTVDVFNEGNVNFESLLLSEQILTGLTKNGFEKPSPVQLKAIPIGRCGFDLIVKSKSGTGKTLVFAIVALEMVVTKRNTLQALILTPTREIATQTVDVIKTIGSEIPDLKVKSFIGGLPIGYDITNLKDCHIAVGAPGRIKHLIDKGELKTDFIKLFVLDEADKLMESSFQGDINEIYHKLRPRKQVIVTSATYPNELDTFLSNYMQTPTHVSPNTDSPMLLGLKQFVSIIKESVNNVQVMKMKNEELIRILAKVPFTQCLVFSNYQTRVESISNLINQKGWNSNYISAAQSQKQRLQVVSDFKEFKFRVLLSTDLTARGIDVSNVDLVINYDIPNDVVTYLHRMGRAGRYGAHGLCITIAMSNKELEGFQNILGAIGSTTLSIAKLPLNDELWGDIWNTDYNSFERVYGTVEVNNEKDISNNINSSVLDLKRSRNTNENNKNEGVLTPAIDENLKDSENDNYNRSNKTDNFELDLKNVEKKNETSIIDVKNETTADYDVFNLENIKRKETEVISKFLDVDPLALLQKLANGQEVDVETSECSFNNVVVNQSLQTSSIEKDLKNRKRKNTSNANKTEETRQVLSDNSDSHKHEDKKKQNEDIDYIFNKNVALLNVSKLLDNDVLDEDISQDNIPTENYLQNIKNSGCIDNAQFNEIEPKQILENIDRFGKKLNSKIYLDNIYKYGFDYATKSDAKHWLTFIPEDEQKKFEEFCSEKSNHESSDDETNYNDEFETDANGDDNYDYVMKNSEEKNVCANTNIYLDKNDPSSSYFKNKDTNTERYNFNYVQRQNPESGVVPFSEHYADCYRHTSDHLFNTALTFDNVQDFDVWYEQWINQLHDVRNYVQQNIYVEEMSNYQQCMLRNQF